jgi:hypothetical protein
MLIQNLPATVADVDPTADLRHTRSLLARQPGLPTARLPRTSPAAVERLRRALSERPQFAQVLLDGLGDQAGSISRWTYCLALELGPPCGRALAALLPGVLQGIERRPPSDARALRHLDATLCAVVDLVERLAPERIPELYIAVMERRGVWGRSPWWTFRAWQRLTAVLQTQVAAGNPAAMDLVLEQLAAGTAAPPGSAAHWRAAWAATQLVPHLPGVAHGNNRKGRLV